MWIEKVIFKWTKQWRIQDSLGFGEGGGTIPIVGCKPTILTIQWKHECIPVGCIPPAHWLHLVVVGRGVCATHILLPCTLPFMPPAMHTPLPCMPPATHAPLPCTPPCHACPHHAGPLPCMSHHGQNSWYMLLKTLPSRNLVVGGKNCVKEVIPASNVLCKTPRCYHRANNKTKVVDRIFKVSPIHVSVSYQIHWILLPFRGNSNT